MRGACGRPDFSDVFLLSVKVLLGIEVRAGSERGRAGVTFARAGEGASHARNSSKDALFTKSFMNLFLN